jgi:hypothetical protein
MIHRPNNSGNGDAQTLQIFHRIRISIHSTLELFLPEHIDKNNDKYTRFNIFTYT